MKWPCPKPSMHARVCRELAIQLARDVLPVLESKAVKMYLVTIATPEVSAVTVQQGAAPHGLPYITAT